jgi:quercetin dioxygenase-like cupin family protein
MDITSIPISFEDERGKIIDILKKEPIDYVTIIHSKKGAVRGNHYHKLTYQYLYVLGGKALSVAQNPGGERHERVLSPGDLLLNTPLERHAFKALEDSTWLVLTRGPRGGDDYENDTFRLDEPLIARA